jgi:FkbM family methyltransferase
MPEEPHPDQAQTYRAQNGEDRWLEAYFASKRDGFYVEVGAYDGSHLSNTFHFEQIGWTGVLVEPDPVMAAQCRRDRPGSRTYACAVVGPGVGGEIVFFRVAQGQVYSTSDLSPSHRERLHKMGLQWEEIRVPARTLDSILAEVAPRRIDFVSIDVEGGELQVLGGFDLRRWQPAIVIVETNARRRDPAIRDYFVARGYAYRHSIDVNDFYAPQAQGAIAVRLVDGVRYLRHRIRRRLARLGQLARRAWRKGFGGSSDG